MPLGYGHELWTYLPALPYGSDGCVSMLTYCA
jgi:hypothetical protein